MQVDLTAVGMGLHIVGARSNQADGQATKQEVRTQYAPRHTSTIKCRIMLTSGTASMCSCNVNVTS